ncbi:MAG TPA: hypothetical protein VGC97_12610 [Pyrinomonadaceae bacterium]|jgi:hypothetical protein
MKKFLALTLLLGSSVIFVPSIEAKNTTNNTLALSSSAAPQIRIQLGGRNRNRNRARVETRTRIVRSGGRAFREVVEYRYRANGSVTTRVLSRSRIR